MGRYRMPVLVAAGFRVATLDLRGHGDSDATFTRYDDVAAGQDALALVEHLDGPAVLLGSLRRDLAVLATTELADALTAAVLGKSGGEALDALADAYPTYARERPGRYAATVRAPAPADAEHVAAVEAVLRVVLAVLAGYGLSGDDALDATRALRAALHGFVGLEVGGGFGLPLDVDRSFRRLVLGLDDTLHRWTAVHADVPSR